MLVARSVRKAILVALGTVAGFLASAGIATAEIVPTFMLEQCTWHSTQIVVVTEGDKIDGELEVLESWKGELKKGERLSIPELAELAPEEKRVINDGPEQEGVKRPTHVTCARMVLFLKKDREKGEEGKPDKVVWRPTSIWRHMKVSGVWVEGGRVYAVEQRYTRASELCSISASEKEFRAQVDAILKIQTDLYKALSQSDSAKLSDGMLPLLKTDSWYVRRMIVETSARAGTTALPALRKVMRDDKLEPMDRVNALMALAEAGGAAVGPELTDLLKEELAFWKKVAPGLKKGWSNATGENWQEERRLVTRLGWTLDVLRAVKQARPLICKDSVIALRDFWRSLPQLAEKGEPVKYCDDVLAELERMGPNSSGSE